MPTATPAETLVAVLAMGVVALICRWVFTPNHTHTRQSPPPQGVDYGLLVAVATVRTHDDAVMLRDLLIAQGVRASVSPTNDVLVFTRDLDRARALVSSR